jgi:hypothetical protein
MRVAEEGAKRRYVIRSHEGWKNERLHFSIPRVQNAVLCLEGRSVPYMWRLYPELALVGGAIGIGRIGADYWAWTYEDGWRGGGQVGMGVKACLWPGRRTAHSSARFEMMREGLQEAEARVFLERALEGSLGKTEAGGRLRRLLAERLMATLHIPRSFYSVQAGEQHLGWQERSWDLYAAVAEAAGGTPPTEAERRVFLGPGVTRP